MDPFLTTYRKDYVPKAFKPLCPISSKSPEFQDPVAEGFKHYLVSSEEPPETDAPALEPPYEDVQDYMEKFKRKYDKLGKIYFVEPLDTKAIYTNSVEEGITEYQKKFCDIMKDIEYFKERKKKKFQLPEDAKIPLTTHNAVYRNPVSVDRKSLEPVKVIVPPTTMGYLEKFHDLMGVKPEVTEYMGTIGELGHFITTENWAHHLAQQQKKTR